MNVHTENQGRIIGLLNEIAESKGIAASGLGPDTELDQIGLESLDFATVVIRMEELTGKDPFATGADHQIRVLADLAMLYD